MGTLPVLEDSTVAVLGTGAISITTVMVSGRMGLENQEHYPYKDVVGIVAVCDGHIGNDIAWSKYYSDKECDALTRKDMTRIAAQVDPHIKVQTTETQRAAIYSFTYNVGVTATTNSILLKKLNTKDHAGAYSKPKRRIYAGGKKWRRLMNRRDAGYEVYIRSKK